MLNLYIPLAAQIAESGDGGIMKRRRRSGPMISSPLAWWGFSRWESPSTQVGEKFLASPSLAALRRINRKFEKARADL